MGKPLEMRSWSLALGPAIRDKVIGHEPTNGDNCIFMGSMKRHPEVMVMVKVKFIVMVMI